MTCTASQHSSQYAVRRLGCTCPDSEFYGYRRDVIAERARRAEAMVRRGRRVMDIAEVLGVSDRTVYRDLVRLRSNA